MGNIEDRLAAAKLWLISPHTKGPDSPCDLPYIAHALYAITTVVTPDVPTMTVDEHWRVYINPDWAINATIPDLGRELAHLTWHLLMDHAPRARTMGVAKTTAKHWHQATDLTIDDTLDNTGACPKHLDDEAHSVRQHTPGTNKPGLSSEEYYAVLSRLPVTPTDPKHPDQSDLFGNNGPANDEWDSGSCGSGCDGIPRTTDLPGDADIGSLDHIDADAIRMRVAIAYQEHMKGRGDQPLEAMRWAQGITDPEIPWEPLLARAVRHAVGWANGRVDPTWTRPSRRQSVTPQFPQPGWRRPVPSIAIVIDTSGSIDDLLLGKAMAEVDGALSALGVPGASIMTYSCDAAVQAGRPLRKSKDMQLVGGGGTDMRVGIAAASENKPRPDLIVVFTDGYTPWPATPPPGSAVIVAILRRPDEDAPDGTPAWATRIDCVLHK